MTLLTAPCVALLRPTYRSDTQGGPGALGRPRISSVAPHYAARVGPQNLRQRWPFRTEDAMLVTDSGRTIAIGIARRVGAESRAPKALATLWVSGLKMDRRSAMAGLVKRGV